MSFFFKILKGIAKEIQEQELFNAVLRKSQNFDTLDFENLYIVYGNVNIDIINSDDINKYGIEIYTNESDDISDISIITEYQTETKSCSLSISKKDNVINCNVHITLPRNLCYSLSGGNGNVKIEDVTSNNISIISDNGNVKLTSSVIEHISTTTHNGNIKVNGCLFNNSDLCTKNGNIKVFLSSNEYQITTKTHHGNVKLYNISNISSAAKILNCTTNNGNIKISC